MKRRAFHGLTGKMAGWQMATRKGDLRGGVSLWQGLNRTRIPRAPLRHDHRTGVLVIGAGISGALIAETLSEEGLDVTIVDRRGPLKGSTPASTALLQYEIDEPLTSLYKKMGKGRAQRIYRRSRLAVDALRERTRRLGIDCNSVNRDSLYIEGNELGAAELFEEARARQEAGFEVSFLTRKQVQDQFLIRKRAALLGRENMAADPVKLAGGYLRTALSRGAKLFAPVEVTEVQAGVRSVRARTKDGPVIRANHAIFATGYEFPDCVPQKGHKIASTWALATRPQPRKIWPQSVFIWEAADPYLYMRAGPNGEIICGGEDEDFQNEEIRDALMDTKISIIEAKLKQMFPHVDARAQYRWCGSFGTSKTGTPSIGPIPKMKNCYAVMGFGGNGITFSMMAAQMLRGMICGNGDPDLDLVSFNRDF